MEALLTEEALEKETKVENTQATSPKRLFTLSTLDASPLTAQDRIVLAVLAELKNQGYEFKTVNLNSSGLKQAGIILTGRVWK
jgi:benzoyl-CoA reductase/2-hydroxyglutaryl-CoA dehydratase subunit BcrC/BadD/HgdB